MQTMFSARKSLKFPFDCVALIYDSVCVIASLERTKLIGLKTDIFRKPLHIPILLLNPIIFHKVDFYHQRSATA